MYVFFETFSVKIWIPSNNFVFQFGSHHCCKCCFSNSLVAIAKAAFYHTNGLFGLAVIKETLHF